MEETRILWGHKFTLVKNGLAVEDVETLIRNLTKDGSESMICKAKNTVKSNVDQVKGYFGALFGSKSI